MFRIDPQTNKVIASIKVATVGEEYMVPLFVGPHGIWAPISPWPDGRHNQLLRIDPSTNQVTLKIPIDGVVAVADLPDRVWAAADTRGSFSLAGGSRKRLLEVDPLTGKTLRTIDLGPAAAGEHYKAAGFTYQLGSLWAIVADHEVDRVDPMSGRIIAAISTPGEPIGMTNLAFQGSSAFVSEDDGTMARIDTATNCVDGVMYIGGRRHPVPDRTPVIDMSVASGPDGLNVSFDAGALALVDPANMTVVKSVRVVDNHGLNGTADAYGSIWYPTFDNGTILRLKPLA